MNDGLARGIAPAKAFKPCQQAQPATHVKCAHANISLSPQAADPPDIYLQQKNAKGKETNKQKRNNKTQKQKNNNNNNKKEVKGGEEEGHGEQTLERTKQTIQKQDQT